MARKNRGRSPKQRISDAEKRQRALQLYKRGLTLEQIAKVMGYAHRSGPQKLISSAIDDLWRPEAEDVRQLKLEQIREDYLVASRLLAANRRMALAGDSDIAKVVVSALKLRCDLRDQEAKLLGLHAPTKHQVTGANGGPVACDFSRLSDDELDHIVNARVDAGGGGTRAASTDADGAPGEVHPVADAAVGDPESPPADP